MGVDWYSTQIYGTTSIKELSKNPYLGKLPKMSINSLFLEPEKYQGLEIHRSDAGFHGYGARVNLNRKHDATKRRVERIFKKLGLGKPKYCTFTELSV